ncbi:MAG: PD-(D/E)XK nuclease family protein, partial [Ignavibacteriales bacterium]|nr:PD-(D/E)XK nuclease family protein [Ignavibacteriales bacterium]
AHFVRKALGERINGSFIPPRLFSIDEFIEHLYRRQHSSPVKNLEPIDAVSILHEIHCNLDERLGEDFFTSLDAFIPIGLKLLGELEELKIATLSDKQIGEHLTGLTYSRLYSLPRYYYHFYKVVAERGFVTRAMRYAFIADNAQMLDLSAFSNVIISGFLALTNSEKQIFTELRNRENTIFIYQNADGMADHFKALNIESPATGPLLSHRPAIHFYQAPDMHGQVFALSSCLKEQLVRDNAVNEKTVIVLPTAEALFPVINQTLSLLPREQYNIALGYPLSRTPIFGFLNNLMELISTKQNNRYAAPAYLKFVLHPYTKNIRFERRSDVTRILFHALEEFITSDRSKMLFTLEELESAGELFTNLPFTLAATGIDVSAGELREHLKTIHTETIRKFDALQSVGDFAKKSIEILLYTYEHSTANLHTMFHSFAERMLDVFHSIEVSLLATQTFERPEGYFNFFRRYIAAQEVPFSGTPLTGLQVLGLLETRNLQFDNVYILDMNDDIIPGGIGQEMLLPQGLRESLGLETYKNREKLSEHYFQLLLRGAKNVHLFYTEAGKSEKSRFIEKLLWEQQKAAGMVTTNDFVRTIRYDVKLANTTPTPTTKTTEMVAFLKGFSYSASALDTYLRCQLKFYYQYVLRLYEKEEASTELDAQDVGIFVHAALKNYFEPLKNKPLTKADILPERIDAIVDELFPKQFGTEAAGASYLLNKQVKNQLKAFLSNYQIPVLEQRPVAIQVLEEEIQVTKSCYSFKGRFDRIEQRGNQIFILDYKTGKDDKNAKINFKKLDINDRASWEEAISSVQLPFYLLLYSTKYETPIEQVYPAYLFLGRTHVDADIETGFEDDPAERIESYKKIESVIFGLLNEITTKENDFLPTKDFQQNCPRCPFNTICGTQWVRGWEG